MAELSNLIEFIPVNKNEIDIACKLWGDSILKGQQLVGEKDINFDIIICAQWKNLTRENPGQEVVIATENIRHLRRFANAEKWENI